MNARRYLLFALVLGGLLVGTILVLDVAILQSETTTEAGTGTSQLGDSRAPLAEPLTLLVLGEGPVADGLDESLEADLATRFPSVTTSENTTQDFDGPVLAVAVTDRALDYDPLTPSGRVTADFAFVGTGNASFAASLATGAQLVVTNEEPYVVRGELTLSDRSRGFASRPGYDRHLRDALSEALARELFSAPGME